jgi:predicted nuclease of predicted toxin-antitoxin system
MTEGGLPARTVMVDNQLPVALARWLGAQGCRAVHVRDIGLDTADDRSLWAYAGERGWVMLTKDEDFQDLALRLGPPPQVVWVRLGNCRKAPLLDAFGERWGDIAAALDRGEALIELTG